MRATNKGHQLGITYGSQFGNMRGASTRRIGGLQSLVVKQVHSCTLLHTRHFTLHNPRLHPGFHEQSQPHRSLKDPKPIETFPLAKIDRWPGCLLLSNTILSYSPYFPSYFPSRAFLLSLDSTISYFLIVTLRS